VRRFSILSILALFPSLAQAQTAVFHFDGSVDEYSPTFTDKGITVSFSTDVDFDPRGLVQYVTGARALPYSGTGNLRLTRKLGEAVPVGAFANFSEPVYSIDLQALECGCETLSCGFPGPSSDEFRIEAYTGIDGQGSLVASLSPARAELPFDRDDYQLVRIRSQVGILSLRLQGMINCAYFDEMVVDATAPMRFRRGDCNIDGTVDLADAIAILAELFLGDPRECADACDPNDDGAEDVSDVVLTLSVLFLGEGSIPAPGLGACGVDPTDDAVGCEQFTACP